MSVLWGSTSPQRDSLTLFLSFISTSSFVLLELTQLCFYLACCCPRLQPLIIPACAPPQEEGCPCCSRDQNGGLKANLFFLSLRVSFCLYLRCIALANEVLLSCLQTVLFGPKSRARSKDAVSAAICSHHTTLSPAAHFATLRFQWIFCDDCRITMQV